MAGRLYAAIFLFLQTEMEYATEYRFAQLGNKADECLGVLKSECLVNTILLVQPYTPPHQISSRVFPEGYSHWINHHEVLQD